MNGYNSISGHRQSFTSNEDKQIRDIHRSRDRPFDPRPDELKIKPRKYMHRVLVNRSVKLAQFGEFDRLDTTISVKWDLKPQIKQTYQHNLFDKIERW